MLCLCVCVCVWVQVTLSGRDVDKGMSVRTSGAQITAITCNEAEGSAFNTQCICVHAHIHIFQDYFSLPFVSQI